jgi:hypothetical protein
VDLKETGCEAVKWNQVAQDSMQWQSFGEHNDEPLCPTKDEKYDRLSTYQLLKNFTPPSQSVG